MPWLACCAACLLGIGALLAAKARASEFALPADGATIVGHPRVVTIPKGSQVTLLDIARHYDVGYQAIVNANPHTDVWLPGAGSHILVPTQYLLPPKPWKGIVINIPERRLFYFPPSKHGAPKKVLTFPVGIFQPGFPDPLGKTRIIAKFRDPKWVVPEDIRKQAKKNGRSLPKVVAPGPYNPMGELALETGFSEIYIHGTSKPWGVGMRPSHGCFHLYPEDAKTAFKHVPVGTPVRIVNKPFLVGRSADNTLYITAFKPLKAYEKKKKAHKTGNRMQDAIDALTDYIVHHRGRGQVEWLRVRHALKALSPLPVAVSVGSPSLKVRLARVAPHSYNYPPYKNANNGTPPAPQQSAPSQHQSHQSRLAEHRAKQSRWTVQVASFDKEGDARRLIKRLQGHYSVDAFESRVTVKGKTFHRVFAGRLSAKRRAVRLAAKLTKELGHPVRVRQQS